MTESNRQSGEKEERIIEIEIERLRPFKEHPFQVKDDKEMFLLQESIEKYDKLSAALSSHCKRNGGKAYAGGYGGNRYHCNRWCGNQSVSC